MNSLHRGVWGSAAHLRSVLGLGQRGAQEPAFLVSSQHAKAAGLQQTSPRPGVWLMELVRFILQTVFWKIYDWRGSIFPANISL